jgi:osmoprotectant transport system ATP-binding protein
LLTSNSEAEPVLRATGLVKDYPGKSAALNGVSLDVRPGETVVLIGESGSGKSTLLRIFNRLIDPTAGAVFLRGRPIADEDPVRLRRHLGYVPQEGGLVPHWTVRRNVEMVPRLLGWSRARISERTRQVLDLVRLPADELGERHPRSLSGGQRQRVAIARALAGDPDLVLLDEPFGALDLLTRANLQDEFRTWKAQLQKTLLLVTHDLDEAFRLADRVAVMQSGRLEQIGTPAELRDAPATEYVRGLLDHHLRRSRA